MHIKKSKRKKRKECNAGGEGETTVRHFNNYTSV